MTPSFRYFILFYFILEGRELLPRTFHRDPFYIVKRISSSLFGYGE